MRTENTMKISFFPLFSPISLSRHLLLPLSFSLVAGAVQLFPINSLSKCQQKRKNPFFRSDVQRNKWWKIIYYVLDTTWRVCVAHTAVHSGVIFISLAEKIKCKRIHTRSRCHTRTNDGDFIEILLQINTYILHQPN